MRLELKYGTLIQIVSVISTSGRNMWHGKPNVVTDNDELLNDIFIFHDTSIIRIRTIYGLKDSHIQFILAIFFDTCQLCSSIPSSEFNTFCFSVAVLRIGIHLPELVKSDLRIFFCCIYLVSVSFILVLLNPLT